MYNDKQLKKKISKCIADIEKYPLSVRIAKRLHDDGLSEDDVAELLEGKEFALIGNCIKIAIRNAYRDIGHLPNYAAKIPPISWT